MSDLMVIGNLLKIIVWKGSAASVTTFLGCIKQVLVMASNYRNADEYNIMLQPIEIKDEKIEILHNLNERSVLVIASNNTFADEPIDLQEPVERKDQKVVSNSNEEMLGIPSNKRFVDDLQEPIEIKKEKCEIVDTWSEVNSS